MNLELTKKQYASLLKVIYLGQWMVNSTGEGSDEEIEKLEQYILSRAREFGAGQLVHFDEKMNKYFYGKEFEKTGIMDIIEDYDEYTVWEGIVLTLSRRDMIHRYSADKVAKMSDEELLEKESEFIKKYEDEFAEHSFDNLIIRPKKEPPVKLVRKKR
jgi:hypothetical protein